MSALALPWRALRLFWRRNGSSHASALAYRALFAFAPLLVLAISVAGFVIGPEAAEAQVLDLVRGELDPRAAELTAGALASLRAPGRGAWAAASAAAISLYGAARLVSELRRALDALWPVAPEARQRRGWLGVVINQGLGIAFTLGGGLLLGASLIATAVLEALASRAPVDLPFGLWSAEAVALAATTLIFGLAFTWLPERDLPARIVWGGALWTALLLTLGKLAVGAYVRGAGVGSAYGAAGTLVAFLAWVHYSAVIVLYGATLTLLWREERMAAGSP